MISDYRCFFCMAKAFEKLLEREPISTEAKKSFIIDMLDLYKTQQDNISTPGFARDLHCLLRSYTNNHDPYKTEKRQSNDLALEMEPEMQKIIDTSSDPFITAIRLAIAGNIIDFAANQTFDLQNTISRCLTSDFAIDHTEQLRSAINHADSILYLGDNAGEIVFDKLFIRTMKHNNVIFAVRGKPVINDATIEDAEYTGIKEVAQVISNGYDAPSTIIDKSGEEFRDYFYNAGLIISKGQGNLEGLYSLNDKRIFFILLVKCDVMGEFLKVRKNSMVVYNSSFFN